MVTREEARAAFRAIFRFILFFQKKRSKKNATYYFSSYEYSWLLYCPVVVVVDSRRFGPRHEQFLFGAIFSAEHCTTQQYEYSRLCEQQQQNSQTTCPLAHPIKGPRTERQKRGKSGISSFGQKKAFFGYKKHEH